jgi:dimethylargininase
MYTHAVTRKPGRDFAEGLTTAGLGRPVYALAEEQHNAYVETLKHLGLTVIELDALPDHPDACFVEDMAVIAPNIAVITNSGAPSRRGERQSIERVLRRYRETIRIESPCTVDGGDVMMVESQFFIGVSARTNEAGAGRLGEILVGHGYTWTAVDVGGGLHLKSGVNYIGDNNLLITEDFAAHPGFDKFEKIVLSGAESYAANTLRINDCLITPKGFPNTLEKLSGIGCKIVELDTSEVRKMDGGLTCLSLRF